MANPSTYAPSTPPSSLYEERIPRVLIVDDHVANLVVLEAVLEPLGAPIVRAGSGEEALRRLLTEDFAVILLDVHMPGLDGFQTARMIKAHARTATIPLLFVTAASDPPPELIVRGYSSGAVDYIVKPFEPEILRNKVSVFLALHERAEVIRRKAKVLTEQHAASAERRADLRMRRLLEALPVPVWVASPSGEITYANRAFREYAGGERVSLGAPGLIHPEDAAASLHAYEKALAAGRPFELEVRLRRASDGSYRWHLLRGVREDDDETSGGFVVTATDVDEKRRTEALQARLLERERAARESAEEENRSKDRFLATLSHELRTPLHAILGWTRILQEGALDPASSERALATIERNARAQARLVTDLLDVSRIASGTFELVRRPVELEAVVRSAIESMQPTLDASTVSLTLRVDGKGRRPTVVADPERIEQVVLHLLGNAVKFGARRVEVGIDLDEGHARLCVADDGHGIAPEFLPRIFREFEQEDDRATRAHGGLGLGLAIVRHVVELHGGTVEASSRGVGLGAELVVRLPASERAPRAAAPPARDEVGRLGGARVLVVDDEDDSRELVSILLARHGANVVTAASVAEAVACLARELPDAVISDIGMPGEDGYSLVRTLRSMGAVATPAIALTAYASARDRSRAFDAGFDGHLAKPLRPDALVATLGRLLVGREANALRAR